MSEKKNVAFHILSILRKHSSAKSPLTQSRIAELLRSEHSRECDLRTVKSGLDALIDLGYDLKYETLQNRGCKTNWYVEKLFDPAESEALLLALYSCPTLSLRTFYAIKDKLLPFLSDADFWDNVSPSAVEQENYGFTYNLRVIFLAMRDLKMINFPYVSHRLGGKADFERDIMGVIRDHLVKPLTLTCFEGRVYLYGEIGDTGKMRYFALDKIHEPRITDIGFAPKECSVKAPLRRIERKNPSAELSERAVIVCDDSILSEVYDACGESLRVLSAYNGRTELEINLPYGILVPFILRFGSNIEALAPTKLRRAVSNELHRAANKYRFQSKLRGSLSDISIKK